MDLVKSLGVVNIDAVERRVGKTIVSAHAIAMELYKTKFINGIPSCLREERGSHENLGRVT